MAGSIARVLGLTLAEILAALEHLNFTGANKTCAREAYKQVRTTTLPGEIHRAPEIGRSGRGSPTCLMKTSVVCQRSRRVVGRPKSRNGVT